MTRQKFVELYLTPSNASTVATRRYTAAEQRKLTGSDAIDFHADRATDKE